MTPKPPSSSEGSSLPPRHRPNLADIVKDTTEHGLWSFDESEPGPEETKESPSKPPATGLPVPRNFEKKNASPNQDLSRPKNAPRKRPINKVVRNRPKAQEGEAVVPLAKADDDFEDLDLWEEAWIEPVTGEISPEVPQTPGPSVAPPEPAAEDIVPSPPVATAAVSLDEFSPPVRGNATPVPLSLHLQLSKVERIGLVALLAILLVGGGAIFFNAISRLPTETERVKANDFPVNGRYVTILSADSFWRAPIEEGKNAEIFRRGTQLLPVVNLTSSGGPAAVRVLFRNSDGKVIGDAVTRLIRAGAPLQIAATAGFEDVGMHAAYRTGQSKPWTIQVYEAPSEDSLSQDFKKLFEMNISTDRR